jgi:hypothetical protein
VNDPHVVSLTYSLRPAPDTAYDNPPPVLWENDLFSVELQDDVLTISLKEHYPTVKAARAPVDRFLRAWELDAELKLGRRILCFDYNTAEVIDRDPPPPGVVQTLRASAAAEISVAGSLTARVTRKKYPEPPERFEFSLELETLWNRLEGYGAGREFLPSMAYFCLSTVETMGGNRAGAAELLSIDKAVLDKLGELTSARGDAKTARKMSLKHALTPLTVRESEWIVAAVKAIVRKVGERAAGGEERALTLADLPAL